MTEVDLDIVKTGIVRDAQERTNNWLRRMGFWKPGQTKSGLMHDLAEFRRKSVPKPASRDWARIMTSQILDGKQLPLVCAQMAREALRMPSSGEDE